MPDTVDSAIAALKSALTADGATVLHGAAPTHPAAWHDIALTENAPRMRPRATAVVTVRMADDGPTSTSAPFVHANLLIPSSPTALARQAQAAWRNALSRDLASCRMRAAAAVGLALPALRASRPGRVVYLGPPSADCLALDANLRRQGHECVMAVTPMSALDALHSEASAAFVLHADHAPARALTILTTLQRGRTGARTPVFVLTPRDVVGEKQAYLDKGAHSVWATPTAAHARLADWIHDALSRQIDSQRVETVSRLCDDEARQREGVSARFFQAMVHAVLARRTALSKTGFVARLALKRGDHVAPGGVAKALAKIVRSVDLVWQPAPEHFVVLMPTASEIAARLVLDRVSAFGEQALGVTWRSTTLTALQQWARETRIAEFA